jgi:hypothetical protein
VRFVEIAFLSKLFGAAPVRKKYRGARDWPDAMYLPNCLRLSGLRARGSAIRKLSGGVFRAMSSGDVAGLVEERTQGTYQQERLAPE